MNEFKFKVGDRVRKVGPYYWNSTPHPIYDRIGVSTGTVEAVYSDPSYCWVKWDLPKEITEAPKNSDYFTLGASNIDLSCLVLDDLVRCTRSLGSAPAARRSRKLCTLPLTNATTLLTTTNSTPLVRSCKKHRYWWGTPRTCVVGSSGSPTGTTSRRKPVPRSAKRCDLCSAKIEVGDILWTYFTPSTGTIEQAERGEAFYNDDPEWAVCPHCHKMIQRLDAGQIDELHWLTAVGSQSLMNQGIMLMITSGEVKDQGPEQAQHVAGVLKAFLERRIPEVREEINPNG